MDWTDVFPGVPSDKLERGIEHFQKTATCVGEFHWNKQGTLLCTGTGSSRVGYAIRNGGCSWHFRDRSAIELYRSMNGICRTSEVTIKFKFEDLPDYETIGRIIQMVLKAGT